jgi:hypothetical protein
VVEEILHKQLEVPPFFFLSKDKADRVKLDHLRSSEECVKFKFLNNFVDVLVFFLGEFADEKPIYLTLDIVFPTRD